MIFNDTGIEGLKLCVPEIFGDSRGFFLESFNARKFSDAGLEVAYLQDNHSRSPKNVLRGLHFQNDPEPQLKLVRCIRGAIFDVAVDFRPESPTYLKWRGYELNEDNCHMLYIPEGFAHGFLVLSEVADVVYKTDNFYSKGHEGGLRWNDPRLGIVWPGDPEKFIINERDRNWPLV